MFLTKKTQGFTLIETLLVVLLIAMLATAAIQSYFNSTETFKFLSAYQQLTSALNTARSNAISSRQQGDQVPKRYGVCISGTSVISFADTGDKELMLDLKDDTKFAECGPTIFSKDTAQNANEDVIIADKTFKFSGYSMNINDTTKTDDSIKPIIVFYEKGSGNVTIIDKSNTVIKKSENKFVSIEFTNSKTSKFVNIYQVSGLVEESATKIP